jgi:hypothetical protein
MRSPSVATTPSSRHYSLACPVGALRLYPLAPVEPSRHPPARVVSSSPLCTTIPTVTSSPVHATSCPFPAPSAYKRTTPSSPIPHTSLGHPLSPSPSSIEPAPPRPSPAPVSLALLPLLSSSLIHIVLELRYSLTNTMHPSPPPIALGSLAGDLTAASARHLTMGRPPRAPFGQIGPSTMIPYPPPMPRQPSSIAKPGSQRRTAAELIGGRAGPGRPRPLPPPPPRRPLHAVTPPPLTDVWAHTHGVRPRRSAPPWAAWNSFSFSFFHFFFLFSYIYSYIDILCTINSLNKS